MEKDRGGGGGGGGGLDNYDRFGHISATIYTDVEKDMVGGKE